MYLNVSLFSKTLKENIIIVYLIILSELFVSLFDDWLIVVTHIYVVYVK